MKSGKVFLVGAGPGDFGLLTLKGLDCIKAADVIIYDNLVNKKFLKYAKRGAELIYAGKSGTFHVMKQKEINELIVKKAKTNGMVIRLKGGDPIIFGRGAEELEVLKKHGIKFEVVPGVSSAIAGPTYAGIPLTHRKLASSVCFVTGHEDANKKSSSINWTKLIQGVDTVVILMGMSNLSGIVKKFIAAGKPKTTPVGIIQRATTKEQLVCTGTLENICEKVKSAGITAPAIIVAGKVVNLRKKLGWFEKTPLAGKTIVTTRAAVQASSFTALLEAAGAKVIEFPTIKIIALRPDAGIKEAVSNIKSYDKIIFTSVNGAAIFTDMLLEAGKLKDLKGKEIYAIGPVTASVLSHKGLEAVYLPAEYKAEALFKVLGRVAGKKILLPRAKEGRDILPLLLRKNKALVDDLPVYVTAAEKNIPRAFVKAAINKKIDCITFTSSSTVINFDRLAVKYKKYLKRAGIASIGPITTKTLKQLKYRVDIQPKNYTIKDLANSICEEL